MKIIYRVLVIEEVRTFDKKILIYICCFAVEHCFRELKKHDEEDRRARIAYAESLLKRLKAGPQQLESAYMLSKILHEQQKQREEKRRQQETERLMRLFEGRKLIEQAARWIDDQKEQMRKYYGRCAEYKKILQLDIDEKERSKRELTRKLLELEKHECEANTKQMQEVIEKEQKLLLEQRRDRQKADSVAKSNVYQKLQSKLNRFESFSLAFSNFLIFYQQEMPSK